MARVLMLCHDQHLDRRVVAQAKTLIDLGHNVRLIALSFNAETEHETTPEGIELTRIGLSHIVPENSIYEAYMRRQHGLNDLLNSMANRYSRCLGVFQRGFDVGSRANWQMYKAQLLLHYRNRSLHDPLPFRRAFVAHGEQFRSDVVQVHDLPALQAGAELAGAWGVPLIYDAHELYPEQRSFSTQQRRICADAEREFIKQASVVFAVNESIASEMANRYGIKMPIVLTNAIDPPSSFDPRQRYDLLRYKLGLTDSRRILLLQGGFAPHRNLRELILAMSYVKAQDVDLVMMGFGNYGAELERVARRRNLLGERVYFVPAVSQAELLQHSASADVGIIPYPHVDLNSYYCTPNKLFEFIQARLPILANDSPELRRFVENEGFGLIRKMNGPRQIARAIDDVFEELPSSNWRTRLHMRASNYAWSVESEKYASAMNQFF